MTTWGYMEIARTCRGCGRPLPVNGPVENVRCAACMEVTPIPVTMFAHVFEIIREGSMEVEGGETRSQTPMCTSGMYHLTWGIRPPTCPGCGSSVPDVPVESGDFPCPSCGESITNIAPPEWMSRVNPGVEQFLLGLRESVGSEGQGDAISVDQGAARPVAMPCANCGGGLSISVSTPRHHACEFCGSQFRIPDAIWDRLHPVEQTRGWYVRLETVMPKPDYRLWIELDKEYEKRLRPEAEAEEKPGPSRFACFQIHTACPSCGGSIPVNGPLTSVTCPACEKVKALPPNTIGHYMSWVADTQPVFDGMAIKSRVRFEMQSTRRAPYCVRCETDLPLVDPGVDGTVTCTGCGTSYPTFPVPENLRALADPAVQVYCGDRRSQAPDQAPESLPFPCPSCGAEMEVRKDTGRIHACPFCGNDVFLTDKVWGRLHPVEKVLPWFVDAGRVPPPRLEDDEDDETEGFRPRAWMYVVAGVAGLAVVAGVLVAVFSC